MGLLDSLHTLLGNAVKNDIHLAQRGINNANPWYHPSPQQVTQKLLNNGYKFIGNGDQQLVHPSAGPPLSQRTTLNPYNTPIGIQTWPSAANPIPLTAPNVGGPMIGGIVMPSLQNPGALPKANQGAFDWWNVYRPQPTQLQVRPFSAPKLGKIV